MSELIFLIFFAFCSDSNWEDTKSKLSELFSNKVKRGTTKAFLLDIDMTKRLEYFDVHNSQEIVKVQLSVLSGPMSVGNHILILSCCQTIFRRVAFTLYFGCEQFGTAHAIFEREYVKNGMFDWVVLSPSISYHFRKDNEPYPDKKIDKAKDVLAELNQFNQDRLQDFFKGDKIEKATQALTTRLWISALYIGKITSSIFSTMSCR
ncbi:4684_t:CDS:2 [Funneliformis mosseae]|uniref:4684_t:CDS:1 n=1 Tax=Funneliformis mosseae TaxID=27381 RepID=A0A9N9BRP4_FUNMO|nr:4684_t:CDS:2 [Funneliformis mosseae]